MSTASHSTKRHDRIPLSKRLAAPPK